MTRFHRSAHRFLSIVLALAIGIGLAITLSLRAPADPLTPAATSEV
jgi:hypothetical protein